MGRMILGPLLPLKCLLKISLGYLHSHPTVHNHGGLGLLVEQSPLQLVLSNFPTWFPCELFEVAKLLVGTTSEPHSISWLPMPWITNYYQRAFLKEFSKIK